MGRHGAYGPLSSIFLAVMTSPVTETSMTTLAIALKDEIRRLARKEIKAQTGRTARAVTLYRREIALLKRQQRELQKKLAHLEAQSRKTQPTTAAAKLNGDGRFSARSVKAQRRRTGLSAADYAKLVGVSSLTIYNWENQKSRPRQEQLAALVSLRGIGKREAKAKLDLLAVENKPAAKRRRSRSRN
jgi:DNA-binding transcriptional regulator YiaG